MNQTTLCRFVQALLVPPEAEGHQRPAVWKALPTASIVLPMLDDDDDCLYYFQQ